MSGESETFSIALSGVTYGFTVSWNVQNSSWIIDISDASGNPILSGIPMVTGVDLLEFYGYLGFNFALVAQTDSAPDVVPTFETLGQTSHLYAILP
jgi:hypothetical protein